MIKLTLTVLATAVLLVHTRPIRHVAEAAAQRPLARADLRDVRLPLVADAGAGLVVLVVNTVLAVYKPRGLTRYGRRKQREERTAPSSGDAPP